MKTITFDVVLLDKAPINVAIQVEYDGKQNIVKGVQLEGITARHFKLPTSVQLGTNDNGEAAFFRYSENLQANYYYENTALIKIIIDAITEKKDNIIYLK